MPKIEDWMADATDDEIIMHMTDIATYISNRAITLLDRDRAAKWTRIRRDLIASFQSTDTDWWHERGNEAAYLNK